MRPEGFERTILTGLPGPISALAAHHLPTTHSLLQSWERDQEGITPMVRIPPEIWLNVALFVRDDELCHLLGINSLFFDIAMNLRWKEVVLMTRNTSEAMHILTRLSSVIPVPLCRSLLTITFQ